MISIPIRMFYKVSPVSLVLFNDEEGSWLDTDGSYTYNESIFNSKYIELIFFSERNIRNK